MNEITFRGKVLLATQAALLGMIYPSVRGVAVGFEQAKKLKIIYYLDREPNEEDYENVSEVTTEICSDIMFDEFEELCIFTLETFSKLDNLNAWVYVRKEE